MTHFSHLVSSTALFLNDTQENKMGCELTAMYTLIGKHAAFIAQENNLKQALNAELQAKIDTFEKNTPGTRALFETYRVNKTTYSSTVQRLSHIQKQQKMTKDIMERVKLSAEIEKLKWLLQSFKTQQEKLKDLLNALKQVHRISPYTSARDQYRKNIILTTYQFLRMVPPQDSASEEKIRRALCHLLTIAPLQSIPLLSSEAYKALPNLSYIKNIMKQRGYLLPHDSGVAYTVSLAQRQVTQRYQKAILNSSKKKHLPYYRKALFAINDEDIEINANKLDSTSKKAIRRYNEKRANHIDGIYAKTQLIFLDFMKLPKSFAIANKVLGFKISLGRLLYPSEWGEPDLQSVVYDIATIFNAIGKREYLAQITGFFFAKDELSLSEKCKKLEAFLTFLIQQFKIIEATPLKDIDKKNKAALLHQFKILINRYSEMAHLSQRLILTKESMDNKETTTYQVIAQQPLTYEKRNKRSFKAVLKIISDFITITVALGQAVLAYHAILLLAVLPLLAPFVPILIPVCILAAFYTSLTLFRGDTWAAIKQFVHKKDIFRGRRTIGGKLAMTLALLLGGTMALTTGAMVFFVAAKAFGLAAAVVIVGPVAALLGSPLVASLAILLAVTAAVCFGAVMYKAVTWLFEAITNIATQSAAARKKNGSILKAILAWKETLIEEKFRNPVRVLNPLNPEKTIPDDTATPKAIRRARIDFVVGGSIKALLYGFGAILWVAATIATFHTWHGGITTGLQLWTAASTSIASAAAATVSFISGIPNAIFVARGFKHLGDYLTDVAKDYGATPMVNTAVRVFVEPFALVDDAVKSVKKIYPAIKKFAVRLFRDPQRTVTPLWEKTVLFAIDLPAVLFNMFSSFAMTLKGFVLINGQPAPLTTGGLIQSLGSGMQSAAINWVPIAALSNVITDIKPLPQGKPATIANPEKPLKNSDTNNERTLPSSKLTSTKIAMENTKKGTFINKTDSIYTTKKLAATFLCNHKPSVQTKDCQSYKFPETPLAAATRSSTAAAA